MLQPESYIPKHPLLQKHIAYFYFLKTGSEKFESKYYAFPHTYTVLNIHRNATFEFNEDATQVFGAIGFKPVALVQGIRDFPMLVRLSGEIDKVTILFKPLGLNAFVDKPYSDEICSTNQFFKAWDDHADYKKFLKDFFNTSDQNSRADLLENFLLSIYQSTQEIEPLHYAIDLLTDFEQNLSIDKICERLAIHVRTFNRLFRKHLGVSPVVYRKVARFRNSLEDSQQGKDFNRLAELAYKSNYFDQSYFNKIYRSLTGSNPKRFFNKIQSLANDRLVLQFLK